MILEKRKVTIYIGAQPCSFYSDDSEEYLRALEQKANAVMRETARFSGADQGMNAFLSVLFLTDELLRAEQKQPAPAAKAKEPAGRAAKNTPRPEEKERGQISVWDILEKP